MVLLQGACVCVRARGKSYVSSAFVHAQFSMYFWAVLSFGGKPSGNSFTKCYELHYQPKKVDTDGVEKY
jgi:hypothetical protein